MLTGAFALGLYGIPRSTKDVDVVLSVTTGDPIMKVVSKFQGIVQFEPQVQFDTLTWGKRLVGESVGMRPFKVGLFELFDDPFVLSRFQRRRRMVSFQLQRETWLPTPEDVVQNSAGAETRTSTTPATCSPCKDRRPSTWPTSNTGAGNTARNTGFGFKFAFQIGGQAQAVKIGDRTAECV